jgi:hypothetical protein
MIDSSFSRVGQLVASERGRAGRVGWDKSTPPSIGLSLLGQFCGGSRGARSAFHEEMETKAFGNGNGDGGVGGLETVPASFSCFRHIESPPGCVFPVLASGRGRKQWGRKLVPQDPMRVQGERGTGPGGDPRPPRHGTRWTGAGRVGGQIGSWGRGDDSDWGGWARALTQHVPRPSRCVLVMAMVPPNLAFPRRA